MLCCSYDERSQVRIRMIDLCYLSEQAVGLYRKKNFRYPLSLQQGEVANTNAPSDGKSVYTNKCRLTGGAEYSYSSTQFNNMLISRES
jgi:hypothetical protein